MENVTITENLEIHDYCEEYNKLMNTSENTVIVKTEWTKNGDTFQKLSIYDDTYSPIETFGSTTLIKRL